jgi:CubicO group peptidase (beta-lactamase class C family)
LIQRGQIAWSRTFGDGAQRAPVYQAASLSKFVTAIVAMKLVDKGVLALDAPVDDKIKIWSPGRSSLMDGHPVTLRWLLSMRGGINVPGFVGYPADATLPTLQQILRGAPPASSPEVKVEAQPGTRYAYSGGGYEIVEALIEAATGKPFADVARDEIFRPLGLTHSAFGALPPASLASHVVQGHDSDGKALPGGWRAVPELAAAGLWSTPEDIARVLIGVCHRTGRGDPFLSPATVAEMLTPQGGGPYGLGAAVAQSGRNVVLMKRGQNVGYQGYFLLFPSSCNGIVVMTGSDNGTTLAEALIRRAAEVYRWPPIGKLQD